MTPERTVRYYVHGDITDDGKEWYSNSLDIFFPTPHDYPATDEDRRWIDHGFAVLKRRNRYFRPKGVRNVFLDGVHP